MGDGLPRSLLVGQHATAGQKARVLTLQPEIPDFPVLIETMIS